jgi:signal transduction histidine kinase
MLSSIRSRLWISYSFVIFAALAGMIGTTISTLNHSPLFYRQAILQLRVAQSTLSSKIRLDQPVDDSHLRDMIFQQSDQDGLRYAVIDITGKVIIDSGEGKNPPIPTFKSPPEISGTDPISFNVFRDIDGKAWLYVLRPLHDQTFLLAASRQPVVEILTMLRDEVIQPMVKGSFMALFLAFALGLFMSAWIGNPLKRLADGARQIESGSYPVLDKEGPQEIQELAESFNQMSKRVQQTEESQRDFLANVSHELKTPLTSIQGFAQSIQDGTASTPDELMQAADVIYDESSRMHRLVLDLLTLSRLEEGTANMQYAPVNISMIMDQIDEKMHPQILSAGLKINKLIQPDQRVMGDGDRLAQVFTNLVDNAIKFTPEGGQITLRVYSEQSYVMASVTDTGYGIPNHEEGRIFERFYQVDKSRRGGSSRGIGLGLAIARQIVISHNGEIWANSEKGKGSTFFVRLPVYDKPTVKEHRTN